jgi:selenide,water dikinase
LGPADLRSALGGLKARRRDRRVLVDYSTLDDAGVFAFGRGEALVQTVDFFTPVVDDPFDFGQIAAANALSDVYAMGGRPLTALAVLCYPEHGLPPEALREILRGGMEKMGEAAVSILGGHSVRDPELKFGYTVTGVVRRRDLLTNAGARAGDAVLLTKPLGTGILSTALKQQRLEPSLARRLTRSMASLNRSAAEAAAEFKARAVTDVTGYGLLGHAAQMAEASGVTIRLFPARRWFLPRVLELAAAGVTPGGLEKNRAFFGPQVAAAGIEDAWLDALHDPQTSGGLLVAVPARRAVGLLAALKRRRNWATRVGEVVPRGASPVELGRGEAA